MKKMTSLIFRFLFGFAAVLMTVSAQNADPLVFTVGKTFETNEGSTLHDYVLWQPGDAATTFGKRFAIYRKTGDASSNAPYQRLGIQTLQTSPSAIQALLKLGAKFDADAAGLPEMIYALNSEAYASPLPDGFIYPTEIDLEVANKFAELLEVAAQDPEVLQSLVSMGRAHPGVQMCLGLGWAGEVQPSTIATYEVREINIDDTDIRVIGRVTLDSANPQGLVAPGPPVRIFNPNPPQLQNNASPKDHLNVRLRWGTPNNLRALLPHTYGYNIYRIPEETLVMGGINPNTITEASQIANLGGIRTNNLPSVARAMLTLAEAANPAHLPTTTFTSDTNNGLFEDGDTFYYYVAARDIAGHPGPLSSPTLVTVCDRLPPDTPSIVSVDNVFDMENADAANETGQQHLRLTIRQVPEEPEENRAVKYRVYRWNIANDWQRLGGDPDFNFIGEIDHVEGETFITFDDDDPTDLDTDGPREIADGDPNKGADTGTPIAMSENDPDMGMTYWYTVRAVDDTACTPKNYSGHSGSLYGVLRDRVGPEQPEGSLITCYCIPHVRLNIEGTATLRASYGLDENFPGFIVRVDRRIDNERLVNKKIKSFDVEYGSYVQNESGVYFDADFSTTRYYQGVEAYSDVIIPLPDEDGKLIRVRSRLGDGSESEWYVYSAQAATPKVGQITLYGFLAYTEKCCPTIISSRVLRNDAGTIRKDIARYLPPSDDSDSRCPPWIEVEPGRLPIPFNPVGPDGRVTGMCGSVYLNGDIREVRIYRRVGHDGDLQMISQLSGQSALDAHYEWKEAAPTLVHGVDVCYFAQTFDEHGNSSPLTRIGCVTVVNEDFGVPIVMDPINLDPNGTYPLMELNWFCDPVGIDRFEVWVAAAGMADPGIQSSDLTNSIESEGNLVYQDDQGNDLTFSVHRTKSLSSGFGDSGEFSVTMAVPPNKKLYYAVRPIGPQVQDASSGEFEYATGDFSNIVSDTWVAPAEPLQDVLPWPAKPLTGVSEIEIPVEDYIQGEGPFFAYPLPWEIMNQYGASAGILCGVFPRVYCSEQDKEPETYRADFPGGTDPMDWLFKYRRQPGEEVTTDDLESLGSFVVYRYQRPSSLYPDAQPNLVQITPLIDRMAYKTEVQKYNFDGTSVEYECYRVQDPFFIFEPADPSVFRVPVSGTFSRNPNQFKVGSYNPSSPSSPAYTEPLDPGLPAGFQSSASSIWIRDTQPVASGATYQYLIVAFSERGEIKRVIPTNTITHP
ncbi:MAG: hypothetical protein Q7Q71_04020 [Verrucomicrobiota bacterium JB023]|nr:hypothetical protein [Verrucomicrobiota bacterium JB023]